MSDVEFNRGKGDVCFAIARRATAMNPDIDQMNVVMDLAAANGVNGNSPIDLDTLLVSSDFDFSHDVFGIMRHMDRETGKLGGCFLPRCARREAA